ncbi:hypothetical protein Tco_1154880 [Tanacetum coccineum]
MNEDVEVCSKDIPRKDWTRADDTMLTQQELDTLLWRLIRSPSNQPTTAAAGCFSGEDNAATTPSPSSRSTPLHHQHLHHTATLTAILHRRRQPLHTTTNNNRRHATPPSSPSSLHHHRYPSRHPCDHAAAAVARL